MHRGATIYAPILITAHLLLHGCHGISSFKIRKAYFTFITLLVCLSANNSLILLYEIKDYRKMNAGACFFIA